MARKREKLKELDYQSAEYWNRLLVQERLSTLRGLHPKLSYQGTSQDIAYIAGARETNTGRITPKDAHE
jgi:hypothetical protein